MGHHIYNHQSRFPGVEGTGAFLAGSSTPSILSSKNLTEHCLPTDQTPNKDVLGKVTGEEGPPPWSGGWVEDPKQQRKEEVGLQNKQLILFLSKPPIILPMGGCRKEETKEEREWVSESISCPSTPSALWGRRVHHLSRRPEQQSAHSHSDGQHEVWLST